jgi:hypothetical protein
MVGDLFLSEQCSEDSRYTAQYHGAVAALTISIGQAAASNSNVDDVLAVARQFLSKKRKS